MNKHERMIERIIKHGQNLNNIFDTMYNPLDLCKKLRRLEVKGSRVAEDYCNGVIDLEKLEIMKEDLLKKVNKILDFQSKNIPVFLNSDPRGYCLKIDSKYVRKNNIKIHTDMGGTGILSPDLSED